jgi:hypothetical protein
MAAASPPPPAPDRRTLVTSTLTSLSPRTEPSRRLLLAHQGVPIGKVSKLMGHSSSSLTLNVCGDLLKDVGQRATDAAARAGPPTP